MISKARRKADELTTVEGLKQNWAFLSVAAIFLVAVWLRYMPEQGMAYLQALDPYMIYRMSQHLAFEGFLPQLDFTRYFPYAMPSYLFHQGNIIFPAILYWMGPFLFFESYLEWAQFYPALMGGFSVVMAYFLGKELWNRVAGVSSAFFLATIAGVMHRTSAGFFEKEPIGTLFMMMSLYFFIRAWKYRSEFSGIASGLTLGFFTISWGGSSMLWLLYALTVGIVMLLNEDTNALVKAYTPTVLVGAGVAMALNPGRFWFGSTDLLGSLGILAVLWARHAVEELNLVNDSQLPYFVPGTYLVGAVLAALSPLYSDTLARKIMTLTRRATQSGNSADVVAGTVAENQAAGLTELVTQLGAMLSAQVHPLLGLVSQGLGPWPLSFIGVALLATSVATMLLHKYGVIEREITRLTYYKFFMAIGLTWLLAFAFVFQGSIIVATMGAVLLTIMGLIVMYTFDEMEGTERIEHRWYYILPLFWIISNVLVAVGTSRLVFLTAFPVAMVAGYTVAQALTRLNSFDYSRIDSDNARIIRIGFLSIVILLVASVNIASGHASADRLTGSPNSAWDTSLNYMAEETEPGSVILSWWDYGYWFQSIGERPAVADGGNFGYYTDDRKINYPLADYLTSSDTENHTEFLEKHSVDYIVLDSTMVGKYSAVSQISNRDNDNFQSMNTVSTSGALQNSLQESNNRTIATFDSGRLPQTAVYAPLEINEETIEINGPPTLESPVGRGNTDCVLTENGRTTFDEVEDPVEMPAGWFGGTRGSTLEVCVVEHPFYSFERGLQGGQSQVVLVPKDIANSTLVRLYLMNGQGIDYAEPVEGGSNGYVRMWEVVE